MQSVHSITKVVSLNPTHGEVYSIHIMWPSLSVTCCSSVVFSRYSGFLYQLNWPLWYNWNIVESGVKHNNPNLRLLQFCWCFIFQKYTLSPLVTDDELYFFKKPLTLQKVSSEQMTHKTEMIQSNHLLCVYKLHRDHILFILFNHFFYS